jgi:5'-methylthioadenosine phosphorylase
MGRLAVVLGSNALASGGEALAGAAAEHGVAVLQRHGNDDYRLPDQIDHAANLKTLNEQGCDRVLAIGSVGSLRADLAVGSFLCPDDFIALHLGVSSLTEARAHVAAGFDRGWRAQVITAWGTEEPALRDGGVYWQTIGPRFETAAEIRLIASHADIVGMTVAAECIVAAELGLAYAAICVVDNLANGLSPGPLSLEAMRSDRDRNSERLRIALGRVLPRLGAVGP